MIYTAPTYSTLGVVKQTESSESEVTSKRSELTAVMCLNSWGRNTEALEPIWS